jgi:2-amino-4-hydroxy-6-hydroxymethyldihydropteridine diphosphokinase
MILIALGANLPSRSGDPQATLRTALVTIERRGVIVEQVSRFYRSEAWPNPSDPPYVNAVARVRTALSPAELLHLLHAVEEEFGRVRGERNAPRTLDLDLIDYDGRVEQGPPELPHPRAASRAFVLLPLCDIAPVWRHPVSGTSVSELIAALPPTPIEPMRHRIDGS